MIKEAERNKTALVGYGRIFAIAETLDVKRLEIILKEMKEHQQRFIDCQKRKGELEAPEETKGLIEEPKNEPTEVQENRKEDGRVSPEDPPQPPMNGRRLYGTRYGAKYHFRTDCKGLNDQPNYGKSPCRGLICQQRTQQILEEAVGSARSSRLPDNEIGFEVHGWSYHEVNCASFLRHQARDKKTICYLCLNDERNR